MKKERDTVFQVIDNQGNVVYKNTYLYKCKKWVRKHYTFSEKSGRGSWVAIESKVTPKDPYADMYRSLFPEFNSRSNGLFRRYVLQHIITPHSPEAITETNCVAYIINSFHENHNI